LFHAISKGYDFCDWNFGGNDPTKFWMIKGGLNLSRYQKKVPTPRTLELLAFDG
jgi:hypothetical protein